VLLSLTGLGADRFVAPDGSDSAAGTSAAPFRTLQRGLSALGAGDALVLRDGTYSGAANALTGLPNGTPAGWISVRAEHDGAAILEGGLSMADDDCYLRFEGLRFHDSGGRAIRGHHLKFLRNEFRGGCPSGNCVNTGIGTNDVDTTADILLEDSWFHGGGGRYNLLIYNASRVTVRRAVIRHDGAWTDTKGDPEAGLMVYNSQDSDVQNVIVIDSNLAYHYWEANFYSGKNTSSSTPNQNNTWEGCVALHGQGSGFTQDTSSSRGNVIRDCVFWDLAGGGISLGGSGDVGDFSIERATIGRSRVTGSDDFGGIGHWGAGAPVIRDVIVTNHPCCDFNGVSASFFDSFGNGLTSGGTGAVTYAPTTHGLRHLTRIEEGSALKTAGSAGGQLGAQIEHRIGAAGTLHGEVGWNVDTGEALWPWPHEARLHQEMCVEPGVSRGFCASSLTAYVLGYLGNPSPYDEPSDAGTPNADAGAPPSDGGALPSDAGTPRADAGAPSADAGAPAAGVEGVGCSQLGTGRDPWAPMGLLAMALVRWRRRARPRSGATGLARGTPGWS
jgi:hypothetical protein